MGLSPQAFLRGLVSALMKPALNPDSQSTDVGVRMGRYGEIDVVGRPATKRALLEEGSYFVARTPTPGTGVSHTVSASFSDTVPFLQVYNSSTNLNVELDYLKLIVTVAGASGTTFQLAGKLDTGQRTQTTVHMTAMAPLNNNLAGVAKSVSTVYYQNSATASAIPAASGAAQVAFEASVGGISIVGDEYVFNFGKTDLAGNMGLTAAQATCPGTKVTICPPVIIAPGTNLTIYQWGANVAITPLSYSFELGLIER